MKLRDQFQISFCFLEKLYIRSKQVISTLVLIYFGRPPPGQTMKINSLTFQTVDLEICLILIFYERVWDWLPHHIQCMIFQEKYFSCYIPLTDHFSLSACLYFLRYWANVYCIYLFCQPHFPHLFAKSRGRQKRGPEMLQTRD